MLLKNKTELVISLAVREDAAEVIEYLNAVGGESDYLLFGENEFQMNVNDEERFIEKTNASETSALFVGRVHQKIVSIGSLQAPARARIAHQSELALSVKKEYWNIGIGSAMMRTLIDYAVHTNITEIIHLRVRSDNTAAIKLYKKMGFEEIGLFREYFKVDGAYYDSLLMNYYLRNKQ